MDTHAPQRSVYIEVAIVDKTDALHTHLCRLITEKINLRQFIEFDLMGAKVMNNKNTDSTGFESTKYEALYKELSKQARGGSYVPSADDFELLEFYASEAFSGVEIDQSYPDFYSQLMRSRPLFDAFIQTLRTLEQAPEAPTSAQTFTLDFLHEQNPLSVFTEAIKDWWSVAIEVSRDHLNQLFHTINTPSGNLHLSPAMRSDAELQVDPKTIQLVDQIVEDISDLTLHISLEGTLFFDTSTLECELLVTELEDHPLPADLVADFRWGAVHMQKEVDPAIGIVRFDSIPVDEITSAESQIKYGLHLEIIQNPLKSEPDGQNI